MCGEVTIVSTMRKGDWMKKVITFEGWYDVEPGWEFDMPIYMVHPIGGEMIDGNPGGVETLVEDYLIDLSIGEPQDYFKDCDQKERKWIKSMFTRAKNKRARESIYYWKRVVEIDTVQLPSG